MVTVFNSVGPYDIVILSARQSDGLEAWLRENGYRIPRGAATALAPYIRQKLKFFTRGQVRSLVIQMSKNLGSRRQPR